MADPRPLVTLEQTDPSAFPLRDDQNIVVPDLEEVVTGIAVAIANLEAAIRQDKRRQMIIGSTQVQTDSSGNATFGVYQAPQGQNFFVNRLILEAGTFDAATPYTPAAPFQSASAWIGLFQSLTPTSVAQGAMLDFLPTTDGGQLLPAVAEYPANEGGPMIQGGNYLVCDIHSGPTSKRISVRYQGYTFPTLGT